MHSTTIIFSLSSVTGGQEFSCN